MKNTLILLLSCLVATTANADTLNSLIKSCIGNSRNSSTIKYSSNTKNKISIECNDAEAKFLYDELVKEEYGLEKDSYIHNRHFSHNRVFLGNGEVGDEHNSSSSCLESVYLNSVDKVPYYSCNIFLQIDGDVLNQIDVDVSR